MCIVEEREKLQHQVSHRTHSRESETQYVHNAVRPSPLSSSRIFIPTKEIPVLFIKQSLPTLPSLQSASNIAMDWPLLEHFV